MLSRIGVSNQINEFNRSVKDLKIKLMFTHQENSKQNTTNAGEKSQFCRKYFTFKLGKESTQFIIFLVLNTELKPYSMQICSFCLF